MLKNKLTPEALWGYMPQLFVGLFFMAAAFLKWWEALFGEHRFSLGQIFEIWAGQHWGLEIYARLMQWLMPYSDVLAAIVILLQAAAGLMLVMNWRTRIAGAIIVLVQVNVYLAIYHQLELRVLNSEAIWIGIFYFARPEMRGRLWTLMTYTLVFLMANHLYGRMTMFDDHLLSAFAFQHKWFAYFTMSSWPGLKRFVLWVSASAWGPTLWASGWYLKGLLSLGMLTRYRLYFGAALLVTMFAVTLVWLNSFSCEGAFWVIILFIWTAHEWLLQRGVKRITTLLP